MNEGPQHMYVQMNLQSSMKSRLNYELIVMMTIMLPVHINLNNNISRVTSGKCTSYKNVLYKSNAMHIICEQCKNQWILAASYYINFMHKFYIQN